MNNEKKEQTIKVRRDARKNRLLEHLQKMPIIQIACDRSLIARATYYRWLKDKDFAAAVDQAIADGEALINDMGEAQLISLIKEKNWSAIRYWLDKRHPKFNQTKILVDEQVEVAFNYNQKH